MKLIFKFGGTSVADAGRMRHCANLVQEHAASHKIAVVVSAMDGVTDQLLELADAGAAQNQTVVHTLLASLRRRHEEASRILGADVSSLLDRLDRLVTGIVAVGETTPRSRDALVSFGERLAAVLLAKALGGHSCTGQEIGIVTDDRFGEAEPIMKLSLYQVKEQLDPLLERGEMPVVTGFIAATQHGVTTTLGRGGSDYTATILGAAVKADEIWIWSDVDGLMSADPRIVPEARLLEGITFAEAVEMGQFGAKSMHPRALEPAAEHGVTVRMRNTFKSSSPGTLIGVKAESSPRIAKSINLVQGSALVTVTGAAMIGRPGTAARVFQALAEKEINIRMISQSVSEAGISFAIAGSHLDRARVALEAALLRTGGAHHLAVEENAAIVAVVGLGMRGAPGVAARVFSAVARSGISVIAIAQGSSELSISFVVKGDAGPEAVRALHEDFDLGKEERPTGKPS